MGVRASLSVVLFLSSALAVGGCSGGGGGGSKNSSASAASTTTSVFAGGSTGGTSVNPPSGQWFAGDMHAHSSPYSQDAHRQGGDDPGTCFFLAEHVGLDFLALTDHRTMDQVNDPTYGNQGNLTVLDGEEWGGTVHMGMAGLTSLVPEIDTTLGASTLNAQVQAAYDEAHRQGGVVTANHPCDGKKVNIWLANSFDAVEVWNIYWGFPEVFDGNPQDIDDKLASLGLAAIGEDANPEIRAAIAHRGGAINHQALKFYEEHLNKGRHKAAVGGGDRHSITFHGLPTTYVYASDKSEGAILQGIREARTWVGASEGPTVEFTADRDGDGVFESIIGDSVPLNQQVTYRVRVQNALDGRVDVVQNGTTIYQFAVSANDETFTWTDTATSQSWMRLNVLEKVEFNIPRGSGFQLLALSGSFLGSGGLQGLTTLATPYGFQVSIGTRYPTIKLPHELDKILNLDRINWGYSMGAITSPIWAE